MNEEIEKRFSSPLLTGAYRFARFAHEGPPSEADTEVSHPIEVALLLQDAGFDEEVVAAGLLHDVVEDTSIEVDEIRSRFGDEVADLVDAMTEAPEIQPYGVRKEEHRRRVARSGPSAAAIYAADKIATLRSYDEHGDKPPPHRFEHFQRTLGELEQTHPQLPFLGELRAALDATATRHER